MKKSIKIFLIILFVTICIIAVLFINNRNKLSLEEIKELLNKGMKIDNVYFEHTCISTSPNVNLKEYTMKKYWKDNIYIFEIVDTYQWLNFNTNEWIYIDNTNKTIGITDIPQHGEKFNDYSFYFEDLINRNYEYKYVKKGEIDNINCHVVELIEEDGGTNKFWIDEEKGTVLRMEDYDSLGELSATQEFKYTYNVVTEENIKRPDFSNYEGYTISKSDKYN